MLDMDRTFKSEGFFLDRGPTKILEKSMFFNRKIKYCVSFHMEKTKKTFMSHPKNSKPVKSSAVFLEYQTFSPKDSARLSGKTSMGLNTIKKSKSLQKSQGTGWAIFIWMG
jgi:hypothetical protein